MENTGYISLSKQVVLQREMDLISNNIANVNTTAFKSQHMLLTEHVMGKLNDKFSPKMVMDYGQYMNLRQGPLAQTGNATDVALSGSGYLSVQHNGNGETYYTRAGSFNINVNNELVTPAGHRVLANGAPIQLPAGFTDLIIDKTGAVFVDGNEVGRLDIVEFENEQNLVEAGEALFASENPGNPAEGTTINQGMLEQSNVQAVVEMTRMIDVSRQYQMNQRLLQNEHDRIRAAISKLGQLS